MADPQLVQEWLNRADEDFGCADSVIEESPYFAQICFHFQQAAEKYLKAYITQTCDYDSDTPLSGKYIIAVIDSDDQISEIVETNNRVKIRVP